MPSRFPNPVLRYAREVASGDIVLTPDRALLERFAAQRDAAAFTELVRRYGALVFRICLGVLRHRQHAEDAFQATFLVLSQKAGGLRPRVSLGGWLHRVAYRTAQKSRIAAARRARHEARAAAAPAPDPPDPITLSEAHDLLDRELARLPDKFRAPLELCYLEGLTRDEAARRLGWPANTLKSRLEQARERLRRRLGHHGLALPGALAAVLFRETAAEAEAVPFALRDATVKAACALAAGAAPGTVVPDHVVALIEGGWKAVLRTKYLALLALTLGLSLAAAVAAVLHHSADDPRTGPVAGPVADPPVDPPAGRPEAETGERAATRLGLRVHEQAAALDKLPRLSYRTKYRHGIVDSMRATDVSLEQLKRGLSEPVRDADRVGWYHRTFSWDEQWFIYEFLPGETKLSSSIQYLTATDAWDRREAPNTSRRQFVRLAGPEQLWKKIHLFDYCYLRLTPHQFRWGSNIHVDQRMSSAPLEKATWKGVGTEEFGGEGCDVVESAFRRERLWVGRDSGRVRGLLSYRYSGSSADEPLYKSDAVARIAGRTFASQREYATWSKSDATDDQRARIAAHSDDLHAARFPANAMMNELVRFDDYREVAAGVWLPFREVRAIPYPSETEKGKKLIRQSELVVEEVKTDRDLAGRFAELMPADGDPVQDQRFLTPINLTHRAARTDEEIRTLAETQYKKLLQGTEVIKQKVAPIEALVGKPAPALPAEGWVGGPRPEVKGKPYLLHFWATFCAPCRNDLPRLKALEERGVIVIGMHPAGASAEEVEKTTRDWKIGHPTFLAAGEAGAKTPMIGEYPAVVFPYYVLVDAEGRVAGHGFLKELTEKYGAVLAAPPAGAKKP